LRTTGDPFGPPRKGTPGENEKCEKFAVYESRSIDYDERSIAASNGGRTLRERREDVSKSYGSILTSWGRLLEAVERERDLLPDLSAERAAMAEILAAARHAQAKQDYHRGERQRATQKLKEALERGADVARQLRAGAVLGLTPRNEKLATFQVKPLRKRETPKAKDPQPLGQAAITTDAAGDP
jgi:hypothetical protein